MLGFDDAMRKVLASARPVGTERVPTADAAGRFLAETLSAPVPLPPFDYSAMDGYAVRVADLDGEGPWRLTVVGESKTGAPAPTLQAEATCRIFTGAPLPAGSDAVVMQEQVAREGDECVFGTRPARGDHVRRAGEDLERGGSALEQGTRLGPFQLGLVAALDRAHVLVSRSPQVTILCTGDELRAPGDPSFEGSIPESNGFALAALATSAGAVPHLAPLVRDDEATLTTALRSALDTSDLVVTVGGVSVGDHDVVRPALEAVGVDLDFWKVAIRPGKPLALGRAGRATILGLPGNPVSAQLTFALFGLPLLRAMQRARAVAPSPVRATLTRPLRQKTGRRGFYRASLHGSEATPLENQASGATTTLAWADALVIVPEGSSGYAPGDTVEVLRLADL